MPTTPATDHWVKVTEPLDFVPRASASKMTARFGGVFVDVTGAYSGVNNPDWEFRDPNAEALYNADVPLKYWIGDGAGSVRQMTAPEIAAKDAQILADAQLAAQQQAVADFDEPAGSVGGNVAPLGLAQRAEARERNQDYNEMKQKVIFLENVVAALLTSVGTNWSNARSAAVAAASSMGLDPTSWPSVVAGGLPQSADAILHFPRNRDGTSPDQVRTPANNRTDLRNRINSGSENT